MKNGAKPSTEFFRRNLGGHGPRLTRRERLALSLRGYALNFCNDAHLALRRAWDAWAEYNRSPHVFDQMLLGLLGGTLLAFPVILFLEYFVYGR